MSSGDDRGCGGITDESFRRPERARNEGVDPLAWGFNGSGGEEAEAGAGGGRWGMKEGDRGTAFAKREQRSPFRVFWRTFVCRIPLYTRFRERSCVVCSRCESLSSAGMP